MPRYSGRLQRGRGRDPLRLSRPPPQWRLTIRSSARASSNRRRRSWRIGSATLYHYLPYGGAYGPTPDGPGYTGAVTDASGLVYLQARYYDPQLGRFLSTDPVDPDPDTGKNFNRYAYAEDNPYSKYDPSGRESRDFEWEYKLSGAEPPPPSPDDWLGPALGAALGAVMAPVVAASAVEVGTAALANPETATAIVNAVAEAGAGDALGGTSLAGGPTVAADAALATGKRAGGAAELRVGDHVFTGVSGESVPPNPQVTAALMSTPANARAPWHGACAEIVCLDKALNAGINPAGGAMSSVNIGISGAGHNTSKPICSSCEDVLEFFDIPIPQ